MANLQPVTRCPWAGDDAAMQAYHDDEWGVPVHDDRTQFEFQCLEGAHARLSWRTILLKRARYRELFHHFDIARVAAMPDAELARALQDPGIVRNRLKVGSVRGNAIAALEVMAREGSLDPWLWTLAGGAPQRNRWRTPADMPATTPVSDRMSRELKRRGFRFVGPTICYAFMQAVGMVDDHLVSCFRHGRCV